jgi:hypothetical protein
VARAVLHESSPRVMAVLEPVQVTITNLAALVDHSAASGPRFAPAKESSAQEQGQGQGQGQGLVECSVPNFPHDPARGSHTVCATNQVFINRADCSLVQSSDFYGMMEGQVVGLKYLGKVRVDSMQQDEEGGVTNIFVTALPPSDPAKPKSTIQWVPFENSVPATVSALLRSIRLCPLLCPLLSVQLYDVCAVHYTWQ